MFKVLLMKEMNNADYEKEINLPFVPVVGMILSISDGADEEEFIESVYYAMQTQQFMITLVVQEHWARWSDERKDAETRYYLECGWKLLHPTSKET